MPIRDWTGAPSSTRPRWSPFAARVVDYSEIGINVGPEGSEDLGLREGEPRAPIHLAFHPIAVATVDAFHAAALDAGGTDNGAARPAARFRERC